MVNGQNGDFGRFGGFVATFYREHICIVCYVLYLRRSVLVVFGVYYRFRVQKSDFCPAGVKIKGMGAYNGEWEFRPF